MSTNSVDTTRDLKDEILSFYNYFVPDRYIERIEEFARQKKEKFHWLFKGKQRIEVSITDEQAAEYFVSNDSEFKLLLNKTTEYMRMHSPGDVQQKLDMAIFKNRITFKKNNYKFSKFYRRFIKPDDVDFQQFYNRLKTVRCYLSIDPMDFLSASENSVYSSCLAKDSCHHTATTAYLRDNYTIMAYTAIGTKKIGRQFIYINDYHIVFGFIYGSISLPLREKIRHRIEKVYSEHKDIENSWIRSSDPVNEECLDNCGHSENDHDVYSVYFDTEIDVKVRHKHKTEDFDELYLDFPDGLDCSGEDAESGAFECDFCNSCDVRLSRSDRRNTVDGPVCENCLDERYVYCEYCNEYHHENSNVFYIEDMEYFICGGCIDNSGFFECDMNGDYWSEEERVIYIDNDKEIHHVSRNWADGNAQQCDHCKGYFEALKTNAEQSLCRKCLEKLYSQKEKIDPSHKPMAA